MNMNNIYDETLRDLDNRTYANSVIGNKSFVRDNPEYLRIELQRRVLRSQTPKWVNYLMLGLTILIFLLTLYLAVK